MASGEGRESLETMASRAVVGVPLAWRILQGLGSAASVGKSGTVFSCVCILNILSDMSDKDQARSPTEIKS